LSADLQEKASSLTVMEEQLRQERSAHQQAKTQLQQERAALQCERSAREVAQGQLQ
jgi:hypothetical protein